MDKNIIKISVLLPVFNAAKTLKEAIKSILEQTYTNFELIIINDGSSDNSSEIIKLFDDNRIIYIENTENKGLIYTLNKGIAVSQGKYIARMDADDIAINTRLEKQYNFLEKHTNIDLLGTGRIIFGENIKRKKQCFPENDLDIKAYQYMACPIIHPSVMIRRETLIKNNLRYNLQYRHMEDYKLWYDILKVGKAANLKEALIYYRVSKEQISTKYQIEQSERNKKFRRQIIEDFISKNLESGLDIYNISTINRLYQNKWDNIGLQKCAATIIFILLISSRKKLEILYFFIKRKIWKLPYFSWKFSCAFLINIIGFKPLKHLTI